MTIVAVSGSEEVTNLGLPALLQGRAPQLAQLSSSLLHFTTLLAQLPSPPLQLVAAATATFSSLAQATPFLPIVRDGAPLQPGTLSLLLARQERIPLFWHSSSSRARWWWRVERALAPPRPSCCRRSSPTRASGATSNPGTGRGWPGSVSPPCSYTPRWRRGSAGEPRTDKLQTLSVTALNALNITDF